MPSFFKRSQKAPIYVFFKKKSGKWIKRQVTIKESSDKKYHIEICRPHRPMTRAIRRLSSAVHIEISQYSHATIRDINEGSKFLSLVPLNKTKSCQPVYQFAAHNPCEYENLETIAQSVDNICDLKSFEAIVDADPNCSTVPSGPALLHIYKDNACLTSRSPSIKLLYQWELIEPLAEFQWQEDGFQILELQKQTIRCFIFFNSQEIVQAIKDELDKNCKRIYPINNLQNTHGRVTRVKSNLSRSFSTKSTISSGSYDDVFLNGSNSYPNSPRHSNNKEQVEINYPETRQLCQSDSSLPENHAISKALNETFPNQTTTNTTHVDINNNNINTMESKEITKDKISDVNNTPNCDIIQHHTDEDYSDYQLRPKVYMYKPMTQTYVNIFSGSSLKGCYENWQKQISLYSTIAELPPPPLPPKPCIPPKLPPRANTNTSRENKPPPLPPRPKSEACFQSWSGTRIQVALFAAKPVAGRVWFLRVAFMHQDPLDTTFKRVKEIESLSNHRLLKANSLEVTTDITIEVALNTGQGFTFLNGAKQNIEKSEIDELTKGNWFIVEFHIYNSDKNHSHLMGNVMIVPDTSSRRRGCRADMGIDEMFHREAPSAPQDDTQKRQPLLADYHRRTKLCRSLDIISHHHDWRQVAGSLGFTHAEIMELQDKACRSVTFSPTDEVLLVWERRDPNCSLDKLVTILRELGRLDVVQDLGYSVTLEG